MAYLKMLWQTESPTPQVSSWDYWTSTSGFKSDLGITKTNNGIAYYAAIHMTGGLGDRALLISPMASAVEYNGYSQHGYIEDVNNITWWINALGTITNYDNACLLSDTIYGDMAQAAQDLLDRIYSVPFHIDYQNTYYILNKTDVRRTLRKGYGLSLAFLATSYAYPSVQYISDNADSIINDILTKVGNNTDIDIWIYSRYSNPNNIYINVYYGTNSDVNALVILPKVKSYGLEYYSIGTVSSLSDLYSINVYYGTPTVTESSGGFAFSIMGIAAYGLDNLETNNIGIDL